MVNLNKISDENRLIYLLSSHNLSTSKIEKIKKIANSHRIDFSYIHAISLIHNIDPLIYSNIKTYFPEIIESNYPSFIPIAVENYKKIIANNMLLYKGLLNTVNLLKESKITFAVIKSPPLTERLYNDIASKISVDIDIFVKEKDIPQIKNLFLSNNYMIDKDDPLVYGLVFKKNSAENVFSVEFETRFIREYPINIDYEKDVWNTIRTVKIDNIELPILSPENELLYLCLHMFHHFHVSLFYVAHPYYRWLCDINNFINKYRNEINWAEFIDRCKKYGISNIIYYIFFQSKTYLKTKIPSKAYLKLRPSTIKSVLIRFLTPEPLSISDTWDNKSFYCKNILLYFSLIPNYIIVSHFKKFIPKVQGFIPLNIKEFARWYNLPYPSFSTFCFYILRPFLWVIKLLKCL